MAAADVHDESVDQLLETMRVLGHERVSSVCSEVVRAGSALPAAAQVHLQWGVCALTGAMCNRVMRVGPYLIDAHYRAFVLALWLASNEADARAEHAVDIESHDAAIQAARRYATDTLRSLMSPSVS